MKLQPGLWCVVVLFSAGVAVAETGKPNTPSTKLNPEAAEIIGKVKPVVPLPNAQQGNNQQGQFPPGQGPNNKVPAPAQIPSAVQNQPVIPSSLPESAGEAADHSDVVRAAAEAKDQIDAIRAGQEGLNLGILDAEEARKRNQGMDPSSGGFQPGDMEAADLIEQIQKVTGGSNRDGWSETTKGYASAITTDPQSLLNGAGAGRTSDRVQHDTVENPDGTTTETTKRHDSEGNVVQHDTTTRDGNGTVIRVEQVDNIDGTRITHTANRNEDGSYSHSVSTVNSDGSGNLGSRWQSPDWWANVDPDSAYGQGRAWVPGQGPKAPKVVEAQDDGTPGGRPPGPDDHGGVGGPRLNVDVDLAGQPNPDGAAGGSAVGSMIKNPNDDTVDPPRPIR